MRSLSNKFGFRGAWLMVLGVVWFLFGIGIFLGNPERPVPWALHQYIPSHYRALAWVLTGLVAIIVGLRGRRGDDTAGHVALLVMPLLRLVGFSVSCVLFLVTKGAGIPPLGDAKAWYAALIWLLVVTMTRLVAAWPNPQPFPFPPRGAK